MYVSQEVYIRIIILFIHTILSYKTYIIWTIKIFFESYAQIYIEDILCV